MAGFSESLSFDISDALRRIDEMESRLTAASRGFGVSVARQLDQLRDLSIELTVDADTRRLRPEIERALSGTDIDVEVDADTTRARQQVRQLGDEADRTTGRFDRLRNVVGLVGFAGVVAGVRGTVDAFSSLEEQVSGAEVVFGNAASSVATFATSAVGIGLAADEALRASNTFGQLAQSAGLASTAAAEFSTSLVARGADIASLRDLDVTETLDRLRAGLLGEAEPLRSLGVFISAATTEAKAFELGLEDASGALSDGALIQARYAQILEQSTIAAGNFALTSDGLANSQRKLEAEARNTAAAVGGALAPSYAELLDEGRLLLPVLADLATGALLPLLNIAVDLAPVFGSFVSVLATAEPIISAVASAVGAIPTELLTMIGLSSLAGRSISGVATGLGAMGARAADAGGLLSVLSTKVLSLNPALIAGGLLAGGIALKLSEAAEEQRRFRAEVEDATRALRDNEGVLQVTTDALVVYIETSSRFTDEEQLDDLGRLGLSLTEVGDLARQGGEGLREFLLKAEAAGEIRVNPRFGTDFDIATASIEELRQAVTGLADLPDRFADTATLTGNRELVESFRELLAVTEETSRIELARLRVQGPTTAALVRQAEASNLLADGSVDVVAALDDVNAGLGRQREAAAAALERYGPLATAVTGFADALTRLREVAPGVASELVALRSGAGDVAGNLADLAVAAGDAQLSEEQLGSVAATLGLDLADLAGFVDDVTTSLDSFADTAAGRLPGLGDIFTATLGNAQSAARARAEEVTAAADAQVAELQRIATDGGAAFSEVEADAIREGAAARAQAIEDGARLTAAGLRDSLTFAAADLADFRGDLAALSEGGFADLAGLIAQQGPQVGGALADELSDAFASGNLELLEGLRTANDTFRTESESTVDFLRDDLGPRFLSAAGILSTLITERFGENLDFETGARVAAELGALELDEQGRQIAAVAAVEGETAARAFATTFGLSQVVTDEAVAAGLAIRANAPTVEAADGGSRVGIAFGQGMAEGIASTETQIEQAARLAAESAEHEIRRAMGISSPSRVFIELGQFMGEGLALGLEGKAARIEAAGRQLEFVGSPRSPGQAVGTAAGAAAASIVSGPTVTLEQHIDARGTPAESVLRMSTERAKFALARILPP